jgi:hypothetical protein
MKTVELRPTQLEELAHQLDSQFKKFHTRDVHVKRETDAVRVAGRLRRPGWSVEWNEPVCIWRLNNSEIRFVLEPFQASLQLQHDSFMLLVTRKKAAEGSPASLIEETLAASWNRVRSPVQEVFLRRALNALVHLGELTDPVLKTAIAAPSDQGVVVRALQSPEALAPLKTVDPLLDARLRGIAARQRLVESHGGALTADEVAKLLNITRQAVDKRRRNGQLLAVELGRRGYYYPACQFGESGTLPGLESVLKALSDHDAWMQLAFFIAPNPRLDGRAPYLALAGGRLEPVLIAAQAYGEQGAA